MISIISSGTSNVDGGVFVACYYNSCLELKFVI